MVQQWSFRTALRNVLRGMTWGPRGEYSLGKAALEVTHSDFPAKLHPLVLALQGRTPSALDEWSARGRHRPLASLPISLHISVFGAITSKLVANEDGAWFRSSTPQRKDLASLLTFEFPDGMVATLSDHAGGPKIVRKGFAVGVMRGADVEYAEVLEIVQVTVSDHASRELGLRRGTWLIWCPRWYQTTPNIHPVRKTKLITQRPLAFRNQALSPDCIRAVVFVVHSCQVNCCIVPTCQHRCSRTKADLEVRLGARR